MNIINLTVGHTYKNWKELCSVLCVEPKSQSYKANKRKNLDVILIGKNKGKR